MIIEDMTEKNNNSAVHESRLQKQSYFAYTNHTGICYRPTVFKFTAETEVNICYSNFERLQRLHFLSGQLTSYSKFRLGSTVYGRTVQ